MSNLIPDANITARPLPLRSKHRVRHTLLQTAYLERDLHDLQMRIHLHPLPGRTYPYREFSRHFLIQMLIINRPVSPTYSPSSYVPFIE